MGKKDKITYKNSNKSMLKGSLAKEGFELWYHEFWATDKDNGERRAFFIEFCRLNPHLKVKKTTNYPDDQHKESRPLIDKGKFSFNMVRGGMLGTDGLVVAEFFVDEKGSASHNLLSLKFGDNICLEDSLRGNLICDSKGVGSRFGLCKAGSMSWELNINKKMRFGFDTLTSPLVRYFNFIKMYWFMGGLQAQYSGRIFVDNSEFIVGGNEGFGYQDKTWGSHFTRQWFKLCGGRLYSEDKEQPNSALVVAFGEPQVLNWFFKRKYFIILQHNGQTYDFSAFSKNPCRYNYSHQNGEQETTLTLTAENVSYKIEIILNVDKQEQTALNYPTPQGNLFKLFIFSKVEATVHLYQRDNLIDWQNLHTFSLKEALLQSHNNLEGNNV